MTVTLITRPPPAYTPQAVPVLDGGDWKYMQKEIRAIQTILTSYQELLTQAATEGPVKARDGMVRLARSPWRPVLGQTADAWVYYDAAGAVWRYIGTAPTST